MFSLLCIHINPAGILPSGKDTYYTHINTRISVEKQIRTLTELDVMSYTMCAKHLLRLNITERRCAKKEGKRCRGSRSGENNWKYKGYKTHSVRRKFRTSGLREEDETREKEYQNREDGGDSLIPKAKCFRGCGHCRRRLSRAI